MGKRIVLIQGHPDHSSPHLLHALADAYARSAVDAGHEVRHVNVAALDFPMLRVPSDFEKGATPECLVTVQADLLWAEHWVIFFPLWLGTLPALLKAFFEQTFRPGYAMLQVDGGFPKKLLRGRSARVVVSMGMPWLIYRWVFGAHGVRGFEKSVLGFAGIAPVRRLLIGPVPASKEKGAALIARVGALGRAGL